MKNKLEEKYKKYGIWNGHELFIKSTYALQFIEEVTRNNLLVLGIDGFKLIENKYVDPQLDMIMDFSETYQKYLEDDWGSLKKICTNAAKKFINSCISSEKNEPLVFSFFLVDEKKYHSDQLKL